MLYTGNRMNEGKMGGERIHGVWESIAAQMLIHVGGLIGGMYAQLR